MKIPLSVVIITKNEAANIARCLDAAQLVADEIIVVDSYSTDTTQEICKSYQVCFLQHPFHGFMQQKNYALQQATHPYVLSLDADEVLSPELIASIQSVKQNWQYDAYFMNRLNNYCGQWIRHCGWYPDAKIRLFDKRQAQWGVAEVHEKIVLATGAKQGKLEGDLLHYSYNSIQDHVHRINDYSGKIADAAFQRGKRTSVLKIMFSPIFNFLKKYILKLGFLDGYYGFVICVLSAYYNFLKYVKLRELQKNKR